ncbi:MAG: DUF354 domain-containing protein [Desulfamplus sp.]|nr:DUF354 domain-containing protein [Desulfamplus sp.]
MKKEKHIMIIAGEPSGDLHGASLIKELRKKDRSLIITGIGGELMEQAGMRLFFHIKDLSAMGVTEVIMQFKRIKEAFDLFREKVFFERPALLILIDYPGFNLKAAAYAKKIKVSVLYYITPKVWAWNRSRLKKIKQYVEHAALIFPFEDSIFKKENIPATYVGNPLLDYYSEFYPETSQSQKKTPCIIGSPTVIAILPGSRESEISKLLETMLKSAILINQGLAHDINDAFIACDRDRGINCEKKRNVQFLLSAASSVNIHKFNKILEPYNKNNMFEVVRGNPTELFRRCDLLIAASGTVTLEAAICGIPTVIVYKTSPLTYFLAKNFVRISYIGLPNIIAKYSILPELIQNDATPEKISEQVLSMLNPETLASIRKRLLMMTKCLGAAGASERTAKLAIKMLNSSIALKK